MNLMQYEDKTVRIVDIDGKTWEGKVTDYIYPEDNDPEAEMIAIDNVDGRWIGFTESDIKSITIIP